MIKHVAAFALVAALSGCVEEGPAGPRAAVPGTGATGSNEARSSAMAGVLDRISAATCDREQSCNTIGPGATFPSREVCVATIQDKYGKDLSVGMCPGGIDGAALDDCLKSLEAGQCSGTADTISRSASCPVKAMCIK